MESLSGRTVLLTGASGGIGGCLARAFADQGARVALSGRNEAALDALAGDLGDACAVVPADLQDLDAAGTLVARAEEAIGPLDVLVNNAGIELTASYTRLTREELEQMVAVNLTAPMLLIHSALPGMLDRGRGHVVNIASLAGKGPAPYNVPYSATKAGLVGLTHALRAELRGTRVGFSVVCPGFVEEEGMYARMAEEGFRAPLTFGSSPPGKVVDAVLRAIARNRPEVIVSPRPMRPLFAAAQIAPGLAERVVAAGGVGRYFGAIAERRGLR